MITPNEACLMADNNEMREIQNYIKEVAQCGGHSIYLMNISPTVKKRLRELGYKVYGFGGMYRVKWRPIKC